MKIEYSLALKLGLLMVLSSCCSNKKEFDYYDQDQKVVKKVTELNSCSGKPNGQNIWYDPSGKVVSISNYKQGTLNGANIYFCEDSDLTQDSMNYVNGNIHGLRVTRYCNSGKIRSVVEYEKGLIMNVLELFDEVGNRLFPGKHKDGNGEFLKYDRFGDLRVRLRVSDGMLNGYSVLYISPSFVDSIYFESGYSKARDISFKTYEGAY